MVREGGGVRFIWIHANYRWWGTALFICLPLGTSSSRWYHDTWGPRSRRQDLYGMELETVSAVVCD